MITMNPEDRTRIATLWLRNARAELGDATPSTLQAIIDNVSDHNQLMLDAIVEHDVDLFDEILSELELYDGQRAFDVINALFAEVERILDDCSAS